MTKDELRKIFKQKRFEMLKTGDLYNISSRVVSNIITSEIYKNSKHIALYYPLETEIDIRGIVSDNKNFYLPRCVNNEIEFAKFDGNLKRGAFSLFEPVADKVNPDILDVIYIPCLCCNKRNYRLGWGKGFYDRFFAKNDIHARKIIVSAQSFISDDFIEDEFDFKCDEIIADK